MPTNTLIGVARTPLEGTAQDRRSHGVVQGVREKPPEGEEERWPPGEFLDERQEEATRRFVEAARTLAARRAREHEWPDWVQPDDET